MPMEETSTVQYRNLLYITEQGHWFQDRRHVHSTVAMAISCLAKATISHRISSPRIKLHKCVCSSSQPKGNNIKVIVSGAGSIAGKAAIAAITKARGMTVAGAVDSIFVGQDAGEVAGLDEELEIPILDDIIMVLGSLSQSTKTGVMVDFSTDSSRVFENVRQATAFGMRSVVCGSNLDEEIVGALTTFCEKASTGCLICPTLSIGRILLQQAAIAAAFHYGSVQIIEAAEDESLTVPSREASFLAESLSGLGRVYNGGDRFGESAGRGAVVGDGVRVHSLLMSGPGLSSMEVRLSGAGDVLSLRHDIGSPAALMPGLLLAIRRVVRLKSLVYGLEKIL